MKLAISLTNLTDHNGPDCNSPVKKRLEGYSYSRLNFECRSPERIFEKNSQASERAKEFLSAKVEKAKNHNQETKEKIRQRQLLETHERESIKTKLEAAFDHASNKRMTIRDAFRERVAHREKVFKERAALASAARAERAKLQERRYQEAAVRRVAYRQQIIEKSANAARHAMSAHEAAKSPTKPLPVLPSPTTDTGMPIPSSPSSNSTATFLTANAATLFGQVRAHKDAMSTREGFSGLTAWMRDHGTVELMAACLRDAGLPEEGPFSTTEATTKRARLALALIAMHVQEKSLFDVEACPNDKIMRREVRRFMRQLRVALTTTTTTTTAPAYPQEATTQTEATATEAAVAPPSPDESTTFASAFTRAKRFHAAWSAVDRPQTLDFLLSSVVGVKAKQIEQGLAPAPPEETFAQIRLLGGEAAEAQARHNYEGAWHRVAHRDVGVTVADIAQRAFWDVISEGVQEGTYEGLFHVLGELQTAMKALVSHAPAKVAELEDKFDAKWLQQQAEHGALELPSVHSLMRFIMQTIEDWQAPADLPATRAWTGSVEATLVAEEASALEPFIAQYLVPFVRGATERVQAVYSRMMALQERLEQARKEEAEAAELAQQD